MRAACTSASLRPLLALAAGTLAGAQVRRPHILFIVADDLGYGDVSFHSGGGSSQVPTPHIDDLAEQGVQLRNYYVQPVCSPTRSSIMTGRHVIHTGIYDPDCDPPTTKAVRTEFTMLPKHLKTLGYETHAVGKWHLGMFSPDVVPTGRGFDTFYGYYIGTEDYFTHQTPVVSLRDFHDDAGSELHPRIEDDGTYSTLLYAQRAEAIIDGFAVRQQAAPVGSRKSLFLYLAWQAIHSPLQVPERYKDPFTRTIANPDRRTVAGMIAALDEGVGNVTAALRRSGLWADSLIIFSTDNGGPAQGFGHNWASNWPLRGMKRTLWEGGIRAVGLVAGAGLQKVGYVSTEMYHAVDWMPSLLSLALNGLDKDPASPSWQKWTDVLGPTEPPFQVGDGMDVWRSLATGSPSPRTEFVIEAHNGTVDDGNGQAIRVGDYKLILEKGPFWNGSPGDLWYDSFSEPEKYGHVINCGGPPPLPSNETYCDPDRFPCLFNIKDDPCEYVDLSKKLPGKADELRRRLADYQITAVPSKFHELVGCTQNLHQVVAVAHQHQGTWMPWCPSSAAAQSIVM